MAEIIPLYPTSSQPLESLSSQALSDRLRAVRTALDALDASEPEDMTSPDYEAWGDRHEALEDLADEILELLDEREV